MNEIFNFHGQEVRTMTIDDDKFLFIQSQNNRF